LEKSGAGCWRSPRKKRAVLEAWFSGPDGPQALFAGRVLAFDEKAGLIWARLMADGTAKGRPRSALDMIIAAVAEANGCLVVTDNEKDFTGLKFVNPLRSRRTEERGIIRQSPPCGALLGNFSGRPGATAADIDQDPAR
jgi:hypothetical protein